MSEIIFKQRLTATPQIDTSIFELKTPSYGERALLAAAKSFELDANRRAGKILATADEMSYAEGPYTVTIGKNSGALRFVDSMRFQFDDGQTHIEISDDEAISAARRIVTKMKLVPIEDCRPLRVTRLRVGTLKRGSRQATERVIDVGVLFQRLVNGVPVFGGGGKLMVYLDEKKGLIGFDKVWRDITKVARPVPRGQLREPRYAEASLKRAVSPMAARTIRVDSMAFGYYEGGVCDTQRTLQPVYYMPIEVTMDDRMSMRSHVVVAAADRPAGTIIPRKRPRPAEPART